MDACRPPDRAARPRRRGVRRPTARARARARTRGRSLRRSVVSGGFGGNGVPGSGGIRRSMLGAASNTKNRICRIERGTDLAPRVLDPDGAAEPREPLPGDVVDEDRRVPDAHAFVRRRGQRRSRAAAAQNDRARPGADPAASRGVSDDSSVTPSETLESRLRPRRLDAPPARSIRSPGRRARACVAFETSTSKCTRRGVASRHRPVEQAHGFRRQLAEHPPRAARQPSRVASRRSRARAPAASTPASRAWNSPDRESDGRARA